MLPSRSNSNKSNKKPVQKKSKFDSWSKEEKEIARSTILSIHSLFPSRTPDEILRIFLQEEKDETATISRLIMLQEEEEEKLKKESKGETDNGEVTVDLSSVAPKPIEEDSLEIIEEQNSSKAVVTSNGEEEDQEAIGEDLEEMDEYDVEDGSEIEIDDVEYEEEEEIYRDPTEDDENVFAYDDNEHIVLDVTDAYDYSEEDLQSQTMQSELRRKAMDPKYFLDLKKEEETLEYLWEQYKKKNKDYKVLIDEMDILKEQEEEIQHTKDLIQWNGHQKDQLVLAMLKQYRWRSENISHDYWEKGENYVYKLCGIPIGEKQKNDDDSCPACFCDDVPMTESPMCGHAFCNSCWKSYLEVKIKETSGLGQTRINCMDCNTALTQDFIFSFFQNDERIKRRFIENRIETYVSDHFMLLRCPSTRCKCVIKKTNDEPIHYAKCYCGEKFCFQCGKEPHFPSTCQQMNDFKSKSSGMSEGASILFIQNNTKYCPNCKKAIEKNGGCNHMTCSMCRHEFCWLCFGKWSTHNFEACKERVVENGMNLTKSETVQKNLYQHYIYYDGKMNEHKRWLQQEKFNRYMKNNIQQFKADIYMHTDVPYKHLFWIDEMLKKVKEAKRYLHGAYVYAFCVFGDELADSDKKKSHSKKPLSTYPVYSKEYKTKKERERCFLLFDTHLHNLEKAVSTLLQKVDFLTDNAWSDYLRDISKQKIYSEQYTMRPYLTAVSNQLEGLQSVIVSVDMKSLI